LKFNSARKTVEKFILLVKFYRFLYAGQSVHLQKLLSKLSTQYYWTEMNCLSHALVWKRWNCCLSSMDTDEVDVMYVDYGMTEFVARSDVIIQLPSAVKSSFCSIRHCQLAGILPVWWLIVFC